MRGEYCIAFVYIYLCIKTTRQSLPIIRLSKLFHQRPPAPNASSSSLFKNVIPLPSKNRPENNLTLLFDFLEKVCDGFRVFRDI